MPNRSTINQSIKEKSQRMLTFHPEGKNVTTTTKAKSCFDVASWLQQGSLCRNRNYTSSQNINDFKLRTVSFSSSTYATEDNSSLNDSFEDEEPLLNESFESFKSPDDINWFQTSQAATTKVHIGVPFSPKKYNQTIEKLESSERSVKTAATVTTTTTMPERRKKKREWQSAIDSKSGRRYYYDVHTRQTQWQKPLELATRSERRLIQEKERKQQDFFKAMEKNILKNMQSGQVCGGSCTIIDQEDKVESLPKPNGFSKTRRNKPQLLRTISSMDHELLQELTNVEIECKSPLLKSPPTQTQTSQHTHMVSTSFFNSLPQPGHDLSICISPSSTSTSSSSYDTDESSLKSSAKSLPRPNLSKRNSCGTMYVGSTMAAPDKDAAIRCVCGVFRTHIIQSTSDNSSTYRPKFAEYEIFNDIATAGVKSKAFLKNQQSAAVVESDSGFELEFESNGSHKVPSLDEISDYFRFIFQKAQMETDCIIMSLIYVERILRETNGGVRPNLQNWKSLLFSCMIMASKVWDDLSMWNVDFSQACPRGVSFSLKRINELELAVLSCLTYNVKVPASEYAKYYFIIRSMIIRSGLAGEEYRSSQPLDMEGAKKLEFLTASYNAKPTKPDFVRRSKSVGDDRKGDTNSPARPQQVKLEQVVHM